MIAGSGVDNVQPSNGKVGNKPSLNIKRIGVVSRDYNHQFENGYGDFSFALRDILQLLDRHKCDAVLFSLYGIQQRCDYSAKAEIAKLTLEHISAIFLEVYEKIKQDNYPPFFVYYATSQGWAEYELKQSFGSLTRKPPSCLTNFVKHVVPKRVIGNSCILLCGEINCAKYSPKDKEVQENSKLRNSLKQVKIILNPIHDRMTRFEMNLKKKFLSEGGRVVVSVWNKGKKDKNGNVRDGKKPAWSVYCNNEKIQIEPIDHKIPNVEIGILDTNLLP